MLGHSRSAPRIGRVASAAPAREELGRQTAPVDRRLDDTSTLEEWLADPEGRAAVHAAVGTDTNGRHKGILGNEDLLRVIGNFPIRSLAAFHMGITHEIVDLLIAARGSRS